MLNSEGLTEKAQHFFVVEKTLQMLLGGGERKEHCCRLDLHVATTSQYLEERGSVCFVRLSGLEYVHRNFKMLQGSGTYSCLL